MSSQGGNMSFGLVMMLFVIGFLEVLAIVLAGVGYAMDALAYRDDRVAWLQNRSEARRRALGWSALWWYYAYEAARAPKRRRAH